MIMRLVIADQLIIVVLWTSIYLLGDYNLLQNIFNILKFGESVVYNKSHQTLGKELSEYKAFKCLDFSRSNT